MPEKTGKNNGEGAGEGPAQGGPEKLWTKNFVLIVLANFIIFFGFQMLMPTIPVYAEKLGGSQSEAGLVMGIFAISAVLIRPFAGRAIDIYGRKVVFLLGLAVFFVSVLAYNWLPTVLLLVLFRLIHGFGWGASSTAAGTIAADTIPRPRLTEGMGYYGIASDIAMALAPAYGLFLIGSYGFPVLFFSSGAATLLAIILACLIAYRGASRTERAVKTAFFEKAAFRPSLLMFFVTMTFGAIVSFLALYASHLGIPNIGIFFTFYALALMLSRPLFGRLADRRGFDIVLVPGMLAILMAMFLLYRAQVSSQPLTILLVAAVVYGFGFGAVQPSLQAMAVLNVPFNRRGAANGTFYSAFDLGIGLGSGIWGVVADVWGFSAMYLGATVPALLALLFYLFLGRRKTSEHQGG
ncbi:purine efflux pump PbuE [Peptococcaceae bacterium CEB3]|nr:purine efflux pump PbuE [Peptococcaceae bacterium CEB3]